LWITPGVFDGGIFSLEILWPALVCVYCH